MIESAIGDPKKRLMDAAISLMKHGENPTTRILAEHAGVNIAAINYYFQGKDNLLAEALDQAATADMEAWLTNELDPVAPASERLLKLLQFLARVHRNFHTFAHAQIRTLALAGRREHATERALKALQGLCAEVHGDDQRAQVQGTALMASVHYLSLFHSQFEAMTTIAVDSEEKLHAYARDLLDAVGVFGGASS